MHIILMELEQGLSMAHCTLAVASERSMSFCGCVCDLLILHLIFADSEIEDTDNESDDNRGCVCVIL